MIRGGLQRARHEVRLLVPEKAEAYLGDASLVEGTACRLSVHEIDGVRRHRRVSVHGTETVDLQIAAWRVHEVVLRLARAGVLEDRDFDLQDSAWDAAMSAFQVAGRAQRSTAQPSAAHRKAQCSEAPRSVAQQSIVQCSVAQHSVA